mgnify:CR=1 FL=1
MSNRNSNSNSKLQELIDSKIIKENEINKIGKRK